MEPDYIRAHADCFKNREGLAESERCGCFYCLAIYPPSKITQWVDDGVTALCPECGIDAVIGSASGLPIEKQFLMKMQSRWFSESMFQLGDASSH